MTLLLIATWAGAASGPSFRFRGRDVSGPQFVAHDTSGPRFGVLDSSGPLMGAHDTSEGDP